MSGIHLRLFRAQRVMIGTEWHFDGVYSRFWRFYANDSDGASLALEEGVYPLRGGSLYLIPAFVRFGCRNAVPLEHFFIHFDVLGMTPLAQRELWSQPQCVPAAPVLQEAVRALAREASPLDFLRECRLKAALYEAMALCLAAIPEEVRWRSEQRTAALEPVLPAIRHAEAHLGDPLSVARLAACCHLSADTFARRFRQCVGQTPTQYILEQRVTQAAQRLLFTDDSIERIAETTGFGNRFYFSRLFSRQTGLSPAAYRRSGQRET